MMFRQALEHMGWLVYEPVRPVRQSMLGEVVYSEHWQALMRRELIDHGEYYTDTPNAMLASILSYLPHGINQREAAVATSMIIWLGTGVGQSFLLCAAQRAEKFNLDKTNSFLVQWAMENTRTPWVNHGYRQIEYLLAPPGWDRQVQGVFEILKASDNTIPELSTSDYEVCEQVAGWLGTELGQAFVKEAEREIELRRFARPPSPKTALTVAP